MDPDAVSSDARAEPEICSHGYVREPRPDRYELLGPSMRARLDRAECDVAKVRRLLAWLETRKVPLDPELARLVLDWQ